MEDGIIRTKIILKALKNTYATLSFKYIWNITGP